MAARPRHRRNTAPPPPSIADLARSLGLSEDYVRELGEEHRRYAESIAPSNLREEYYSAGVRWPRVARLVHFLLRVPPPTQRPERG